MSLSQTILRLDSWLYGVALGLLATPAFAARFPFGLDTALTQRDWLLVGSLVLLAVALALRLMQHRGAPDAGPQAPDLRWWMNP